MVTPIFEVLYLHFISVNGHVFNLVISTVLSTGSQNYITVSYCCGAQKFVESTLILWWKLMWETLFFNPHLIYSKKLVWGILFCFLDIMWVTIYFCTILCYVKCWLEVFYIFYCHSHLEIYGDIKFYHWYYKNYLVNINKLYMLIKEHNITYMTKAYILSEQL